MTPKYCSKCGAKLAPGAKFCAKCGTPVTASTEDKPAKKEFKQTFGMKEDEYDEMVSKEVDVDKLSEKDKKLVGISGWLALFMVGLFIGLGFSAYYGVLDLGALGTDSLRSFTGTFLVELICNALLFVLALLSIIYIIKHKRIGKSLAIAYMVTAIVVGLVDYGLVSSIANQLENSESLVSEAGGQAGRAIFYGCIWIPYFLVSKRVKLTLRK